MLAFSRSAVDTFEDRMVVHLNKCFPSSSKTAGEQKVRQTIRYGMERAGRHGIKAERDVCKFIDLMFVYGRDFDRDPNLAWASAILNNRAMRDPTMKAEALYEAGMQHQPAMRKHG
jgi:hypothetical protein